MFPALIGCGSDSDDSGYGANQPVPATITCSELCDRLADCVVTLCNENTSSTNYDGLQFELASECKTSCTDAALQSKLTVAKWSCIFTDTCRAVVEADSCMSDAHYTCN
jgi:hypothetical protein